MTADSIENHCECHCVNVKTVARFQIKMQLNGVFHQVTMS